MKSLHSRPHRQANTHSITHHKNDLATRTRQRKRPPLRGPSRSPNCSLPFRMQHRVIQQRLARYDGMEYTPLSPRSSFQLLLCTPSCPERPQSVLRRLRAPKPEHANGGRQGMTKTLWVNRGSVMRLLPGGLPQPSPGDLPASLPRGCELK